MTINQRIKELRKGMKLSQEEFGSKIGLKKSASSWIEQEGHTITDQNIVAICKTFHVSEHWLRTGEGAKETAADEDWLKKLADKYRLKGAHVGLIDSWLKLTDEQRGQFLAIAHALVDGADAARVMEENREAYRAKKHAELDIALGLQEEEGSSSSKTTDKEERRA